METKIVWLRNGRVFRQFEDKIKIIDKLPKKIYNMNFNPDTHEIFLEEFADEFEFNFNKIGTKQKDDDNGETYVVKVMNLDARPSLYRGGLVY